MLEAIAGLFGGGSFGGARSIYEGQAAWAVGLAELRATKYGGRFPIGQSVEDFVGEVVKLARELEAATKPNG